MRGDIHIPAGYQVKRIKMGVHRFSSENREKHEKVLDPKTDLMQTVICFSRAIRFPILGRQSSALFGMLELLADLKQIWPGSDLAQ